MVTVTNSLPLNSRGHQRARHEFVPPVIETDPYEPTQPFTAIVEGLELDMESCPDKDVSAGELQEMESSPEYESFPSDELLLNDEETLWEDFRHPEWPQMRFQDSIPSPDTLVESKVHNTIPAKHTNFPPPCTVPYLEKLNPFACNDENFSQRSHRHNYINTQVDDDVPYLYGEYADEDAVSDCANPQPQCLYCLDKSSYQAYDTSSPKFSSRMPLGPGWVSAMVNASTSKADLQAKDADWSSDFDQTSFEAQECHTFITVELGIKAQIPIKWSYADGIKEVHRRLRHRYGDEHLKDAFGVFHNIMEFKDAALAHSDEASEWNSWRGDYERRAEDLTKPTVPTGQVIKVGDRIKRREDLVQRLGKKKSRAHIQTPGLDINRIPQGLQSLANPSEGERLASQDSPKVRRSQKADLKIVQDIQSQQFQKELVLTGSRDVTSEMLKAPFTKGLKKGSVKRLFHSASTIFSRSRSSSVQKKEQVESITPWEAYEDNAPSFDRQDAILTVHSQYSESSSVNPHVKSVRKSKSTVAIKTLKKKISSLSVKRNERENVIGLGIFTGQPLPISETATVTIVTPPPVLAGTDVPLRETQLTSPVHCLTPAEHLAAAEIRKGGGSPCPRQGIRQRQPVVADSPPVPDNNLCEVANDSAKDPYYRPHTPLLPESILPIRRRVVRDVADDEFDDTVVPPPRPRVTIEQHNEEFGYHVPSTQQVRPRPPRPVDPMTPSPELMRDVRPRHIEDPFNAASFGLGRRNRPENVVITRQKVKEVYRRQPGEWTPKTSEIEY